MLNEKMREVAKSIEISIYTLLRARYIANVFGDRISLEDLIGQVLIECFEYAYSSNSEKTSLWQHRKAQETIDQNYAEDHMRMRLQRAVNYMNLHNKNFMILLKTSTVKK